jgi:hypothetical protein
MRAALTGFVLGLLALGPALKPGFVLSYDMVFVPDPVFSSETFGLTGPLPRHVPSDAVVTALATALPDDLVQKLILLSIFAMACASATALAETVTSRRWPALAAGVCYAWNPFIAERLLIGHWAFLLGYAALPWVVKEVRSRRLLLAMLPAAVGGFAAVSITALAALPRRRPLKALALLVLVSLPWAIVSALRHAEVAGIPQGVDAFTATADTPFGSLGSLLLLGGIWNSETVPWSYGASLTSVLWLLVVLLALVSFLRLSPRPDWWGGLVVASAVGYTVASLGTVAPGLLKASIEFWPGFAVFRDGQQFTAPLAVLIAVGFAVAVDRLANHISAPLILLLPIALLPSLAWGASGDLRSVHYPGSWARARSLISADPASGDVLLLPWAIYRRYPWNHGRNVLDPLPRFLHRRVITSDTLTVGSLTIPAEDARSRELDPLITAGGPLTEKLGIAGVRYVAIDSGAPNAYGTRLQGAELLISDPDLTLYRIPASPA